MNEPTNNRKRNLPPEVPQFALFPYAMTSPINQYPDETMVFRLRADKIPKCEILKVRTLNGDCYIRMSDIEKAPVYEQVFKIPDKPMLLKQVVLKPITAEQQERIKEDRYAFESPDFINSLLS